MEPEKSDWSPIMYLTFSLHDVLSRSAVGKMV